VGITEVIPAPCLIFFKTKLYNHLYGHRLKARHKNDTMSMLENETKCAEGFISEKLKQNVFHCNHIPIQVPILEYEQAPSSKKIESAFDLLFEEMFTNNLL
jgi:hypothetical protein